MYVKTFQNIINVTNLRMKKLLFSMFAVASLAASAQNITFTESELYPEGIDYNTKDKSFYVTSLHYGKVGKVSQNGTYTTFIDDKDVPSAIGVRIDKLKNQIIVCGSDPGVSIKTNPNLQRKFAKVFFYDLTTGKRKAIVDLAKLNKLGEFNFANDIALDKTGNVYVTNSFSPIVYKIDGSTYKASIFATSDKFKSDGFGLNGIVALNNGYIVTVNSTTGKLYVIDPKDTKNITETTIEGDFTGADGLSTNGKNEIILISNAQQKVFKLASKDNFKTATKVAEAKTEASFPTTGVYVGSKYYVLNAKLNEIFTPGATLTSDYIIQDVKF